MFQNGEVCISILHPPVDDPQSGELPSERWNPTQTVRSANRFFFPFFNFSNTRGKNGLLVQSRFSQCMPSVAVFGITFIFIHVCSRTILLSIISLLNEPNTFSPANVDASVMYRKWKDSKGKEKEYETIIR
jgi:ubiquitin-conjugating enzyme E2 R